MTQDKLQSTNTATKRRISICELGSKEAAGWTDQLTVLKELIAQNDDKYPGIDRWFVTKVVSGLKSGERIGYVAFENEKPVAAAILKLGESAKICHLRIDEEYQNADLGQIFFIRMTLAVLERARNIHFTLPESLWQTKGEFFRSFGFADVAKTSRQYRDDDIELSCSAAVTTVWAEAVRKLPRLLERFCLEQYSTDKNVLMSVKSTFAQRIMSGKKTVEIRKRFPNKWSGHDVILYASQPIGALVGKAAIHNVTHGHPNDIWTQFESEIDCNRAEFDAYVGSSNEVAAIEINNLVRFQRSMPLKRIAELLGQKLSPPQSYLELSSEKNSTFRNAVYFAELLQNQF